jgi:hypothetical protein
LRFGAPPIYQLLIYRAAGQGNRRVERRFSATIRRQQLDFAEIFCCYVDPRQA